MLSVNDGPPKQYEFDKEQTIRVALPPDVDQVKLHFDLPDAISPKELGWSRDTRKLGIFVRAITFGH